MTARDGAGVPDRPDRISQAATAPLDPGSLVGSYFHGDAGRQWQGCVVAEPAPGIYLVELFDWIAGTPDVQRLVPIADMADWQFYDFAEWMQNTYQYGRTPWSFCGKPLDPEPVA